MALVGYEKITFCLLSALGYRSQNNLTKCYHRAKMFVSAKKEMLLQYR